MRCYDGFIILILILILFFAYEMVCAEIVRANFLDFEALQTLLTLSLFVRRVSINS